MRLTVQKRLAAQILKCSPSRIWADPENLETIKEAITKQDIRTLISNGLINKKQKTNVSRVRARKRLVQKRKGRQKGHGRRKGKESARLPDKKIWMASVRGQRMFLKELKSKSLVGVTDYRKLLLKVKGGFFRSRSHLKLYINESGMIKKK
ncbi:50S ribosomal protein L19e [Candidatus Woesearchaeota archaeon]|nr:50S ribosomal protein L19e [Candidatus Woesearchaeota archaeon]MBW3018225.1 50S ribosomal protein L19e [Candidatus Woesearchaeota archaeon]